MKNNSIPFIATLLLASAMLPSFADVENLRCEYRENPLGIDVVKPRLSWKISDQLSVISDQLSVNSNRLSVARSVVQTAYQGLAGIRPDPAAPGFKKMVVKPAILGNLTWVKAHHDSPYGRIVSNWKIEPGNLKLDVTIPANTTATVHVPAKDASAVTESGNDIAKAKDVKFLRMENGAAVYEVGSGCYQFQSSVNKTDK